MMIWRDSRTKTIVSGQFWDTPNIEEYRQYWQVNIDHTVSSFEAATKRKADARRRRRGTTAKPKRKKKRSWISGRATLPPDRVNYRTISSGRYISPRLRTEPLLPGPLYPRPRILSSCRFAACPGGGRELACRVLEGKRSREPELLRVPES